MKNRLLKLTLGVLFFLSFILLSFKYVKASSLDIQPISDKTGTKNFSIYQYLKPNLSGSVLQIGVIYLGECPGSCSTMQLGIFDVSATSSSIVYGSPSTFQPAIVGPVEKIFTFSSLTLESVKQYAIFINNQGYVNFKLYPVGTSASFGVDDCFEMDSANIGSGSVTSCGSVKTLYYNLVGGANINFVSPKQLPYTAVVNGSTPIADVAISDFTSWAVQVSNLPATTTRQLLTVSTPLGSNTFIIGVGETSTSTYQIYVVPKTYSLPGGSTTTPVVYSANAKINYLSDIGVTGSEVINTTNYFSIAIGAPAIVPWSNGTHTVPGAQGCGVSCTDSDLIQRNLNQQFANDQVRGQLGDLFPFAYFYQISDIINGLQSSATSSSSTSLSLSTHFGFHNTTSSPIEIFGDTSVGNSPFKSILDFLKNVLTIVLYVGCLFYFYSRIKSIMSYQDTQ